MTRSAGVWQDAYSRYEGLRAFLATLSYMKQGSEWFTDQILRNQPPADWRLLDIGCGEGTFTTRLLHRLAEKGLTPSRIHAIDPDPENLAAYERSIHPVFGGELTLEEQRIESLAPDATAAEVVIVSHSLYGFLELPTTRQADVEHLLRLIAGLCEPGGIVLWSMASRTSPAYKAKRDILTALSVSDCSAYGESVILALERAGIPHQAQLVDSYIDVTTLFGEDPEPLFEWTSYFCRLSLDELRAMGPEALRGIIRPHARHPDDVAGPLQTRLAQLSSNGGTSSRPDQLLLHSEVFSRVTI